MADWADIANLWWLRPRNPGGSSSLPAFRLGAEMQQQRIQNDINTKKELLDAQYRIDHLRTQDKIADAQIEYYGERRRKQEAIENDMAGIGDYQEYLMRGEKPPNGWTPSTPEGMRMWNSFLTQGRLKQKEDKLSSNVMNQMMLDLDNLNRIQPHDPQLFGSFLGTRNKDGTFPPEVSAQMKSVVEREILPKEMPPGMEEASRRVSTGRTDFTTWRRVGTRQTEQLPPNKQALANQYVDREAKRLRELGRPVDYDALIQAGKDYADKLKGEEPKGATAPASGKKTLTAEQAFEFIKQANGDRKKAEELARQAGY